MNKNIITIVFAILGLIIGFFLSIYGKFEVMLQYVFNFNSIVIVLSLLFSYIIVINMHELGHLLFGKLAKYKMIMYKVGPLAWKYENSRYKLILEKSRGYNGLCLMIPSEKGVSKYQNLIYYLGGIIINIFTSVVIVIIFLTNPSMHLYIKEFLLSLMICSLIASIVSLIPFASMNNPNDGLIIWETIKNSPVSNKIAKINRLITYIVAGIRPRDIDELKGNIDDNYEINSLDIYGIIYILYNAIDSNKRDKMRKCVDIIEKNRDKIPSTIEFGVDCELCYCYSIFGDYKKSKYYYEKTKIGLEKTDDANANRIKAYYEFYVNKDKSRSLEYCEKGLLEVSIYPLKGIALMEKDLLIKLEKLIKDGEKCENFI